MNTQDFRGKQLPSKQLPSNLNLRGGLEINPESPRVELILDMKLVERDSGDLMFVMR